MRQRCFRRPAGAERRQASTSSPRFVPSTRRTEPHPYFVQGSPRGAYRHSGVKPDALGFLAMDGDGPRFGAMIGLVAVVVATVILVFFGIGYALGRLFL